MLFKKILTIFFRIVISVCLLIFLFRQVDKKTLFELIKNTDKLFLFLAFTVFLTTLPLGLFRWAMLLKAADIHLPLSRVVISFCGGVFFSLFLPSTIGGDVVRSIDLAAHTKKPKEVVATVLLDRLSGYIGLVFVSLLAVMLGFRFVRDRTVFICVFIIIILLISVLLALFNKFIYSKINKFLYTRFPFHRGNLLLNRTIRSIGNLHEEMHKFRQHKKIIYNNLALSLIMQIISPLSFYLIGLSLGIRTNIIYFFVFLPIIGAITLLPISIGGLGLRDATTIYFFAKIGISKDLAFAMSLLSFSFILLSASIAGIVYVLTIRHRRIQYRKSPLVFSGR